MAALPIPQDSSPPPEKMLVKGRHGQFVVIPEDLLVSLSLLYYGEYHEHEWQFVRRFLSFSQVVVDAGANLGTFTVPFSKAVGPYGRVRSFEPQPVIFECLRETVAQNRLDNVTLHNLCLGREACTLEITEPDYTQPGNFSGLPFRETGFTEVKFSQNRIRAECVTLDSVLAGSRLDFLKIDVEGMELDVLEGAKNSLARYRPVVYLENNRPKNSPPIITLLQDLGYRMWWHTGALFNPNNFSGRQENIYGLMHNINMICLPPGADAGLIPASLRAVQGPDDHISLGGGKVLASPADDVDGR
ncbi:MAG: FkbM family methyltransferase [Proteobacteria bacterium]|nr:FkbM family methyltransferase [Pseudomonadota bacterium]